ncbi:MAG: WD40 repeat domain-containing serine/threonine protein kinase [Planctomycetota bacterium]
MKLGRYTIQGELGRGGIGVVFRALDPGGRHVALKLVRAGRAGAGERFAREARLQDLLGEQQGFVPLLDQGESPHGPYLVMPLLTGGTLRDRLAQGPLEVDDAVGLVRTMAAALGRAHAAGVVHRDVKPDNVLFDGEGAPLVADLGLAKHFRSDVSGASQSVALSSAGEMRGTVGYMAPEQIRDAAAVGPPCDVFALGAVLYECLSGRPPFNGDTFVELMARIARAEREPLRKLRPDAPTWLIAVVDQALSVDPARRHPDGAALAAALGRPRGARRRATGVVGALAVAGALGAVGALLARGAGATTAPRPDPSAGPGAATPAPSRAATPPLEPSPGPFPAAFDGALRSRRARLVEVWGHGRAGDPGVVHALALQRDGRVLALEDYALRAWSPGQPAVERSLVVCAPDEGRRFLGGALSPRGNKAVTVGERLIGWDVVDGARLNIQELGQPTRCVAIGADGYSALLALGPQVFSVSIGLGRSTDARAWAQHEGEVEALAAGTDRHLSASGKLAVLHDRIGGVIATLQHEARVVALAFAGERPLTLCEDGALRAWEVPPRARRAALREGQVLCAPARGRWLGLSVSPDGGTAALLAADALTLVDLRGGDAPDRIELGASGEELSAAAFAGSGPEGALLVGTRRGTVLRYQLELGPDLAPRRVAPLASWGLEPGHQPGTAAGVVTTPEGEALSAGTDGTVWSWDLATRTPRRGFRASEQVFVLGAAGPGQVLTAGGRALRLWALEEAGARPRLQVGFDDHVLSAAADPEGRTLAAVTLTGNLELWEVAGRRRLFGRPFKELLPKAGRPLVVAALGGRQVLVGDDQATLYRLDLDGAGRTVWAVPSARSGKDLSVIQLLDGGERALVGAEDGTVVLWDAVRPRLLARVVASGPVNAVAAAPGGKLLVAVRLGKLQLFDAQTEQLVWERPAPAGPNPYLALVPGGGPAGRALVGGAHRRVALVDLATGEEVDAAAGARETGPITSLGFGADGRHLLAVGYLGLRRWALPAGDEPPRELRRELAGTLLSTAAGGERALTSTWPHELRRQGKLELRVERWDLARGERVALEGLAGADGLSVSADGRVGAVGLETKPPALLLLDLERGAELRRIPLQRAPTRQALSSDGRLVAVRQDGLEVYEVETGRRVYQLKQGLVGELAFVPGAPPRLAYDDGLREVRVLSLPGGEEVALLPMEGIEALAGTPDGRLVSLCKDGRALVWDLATRRASESLDLGDPLDQPTAVAIAPDGRIAVGTGKGRLLLYAR